MEAPIPDVSLFLIGQDIVTDKGNGINLVGLSGRDILGINHQEHLSGYKNNAWLSGNLGIGKMYKEEK